METAMQLKPRHRPFCCSVKGHVKMLRLDIINSIVTTLFMVIVSVLALIPETTTWTIFGGAGKLGKAFSNFNFEGSSRKQSQHPIKRGIPWADHLTRV
uniref:chemokine-like factor isoform X5 n=1 Tax=Ictidomys tridecemlineatus TaxID=43179 RepID=UPI001A9DF439|nr:chemokine-like factor isoform X5 [Ictidomys tridecemlineatus]